MAKKIKKKQVEGLDNIDTSNLLQKGGYNGTAKQLKDEIDALKNVVSSDDTDFDTMQEIVNQVKKNKNLKDLLLNKLDKDGYTGTAKNLKEDIDGKAASNHKHRFSDLEELPMVTSQPKSTNDVEYSIGTLGKITVPQVSTKSKWFLGNNMFGMFYSPNLIWDKCNNVKANETTYFIATNFKGNMKFIRDNSQLIKGVYLFCYEVFDGNTYEDIGEVRLSFIERGTNNEVPITYEKLTDGVFVIDNREQQYSINCINLKMVVNNHSIIKNIQFRFLSDKPLFDFGVREHKNIVDNTSKEEDYDQIEQAAKFFTVKVKDNNGNVRDFAGLALNDRQADFGSPCHTVNIGSEENTNILYLYAMNTIYLKSGYEINLKAQRVSVNGNQIITSDTLYNNYLQNYSERIQSLEQQVNDLSNKVSNLEMRNGGMGMFP